MQLFVFKLAFFWVGSLTNSWSSLVGIWGRSEVGGRGPQRPRFLALGCQFRSRVAGAGYIVVILLGPTGTLLGPAGTLGWLGLGPAAALLSAAASLLLLLCWNSGVAKTGTCCCCWNGQGAVKRSGQLWCLLFTRSSGFQQSPDQSGGPRQITGHSCLYFVQGSATYGPTFFSLGLAWL